jgi:hypothetical protein
MSVFLLAYAGQIIHYSPIKFYSFFPHSPPLTEKRKDALLPETNAPAQLAVPPL